MTQLAENLNTQPTVGLMETGLNLPHETAHLNMREARFNMIEQQIRTWEVLDPVVLALLNEVPREHFVAESQAGLAFADVELPIGYGETMLSPKLEGRILQAVSVKKTDKVLLIGTGSGYLTALVAKLSAHVHSVEINPALSEIAKSRLATEGICNVSLYIGDGADGWPTVAPYDLIIYTGSTQLRPLTAEKMLAIGGRLFVVTGEAPIMQATLTQRISEDAFRREVLFETCLPLLVNAPQTTKFEF